MCSHYLVPSYANGKLSIFTMAPDDPLLTGATVIGGHGQFKYNPNAQYTYIIGPFDLHQMKATDKFNEEMKSKYPIICTRLWRCFVNEYGFLTRVTNFVGRDCPEREHFKYCIYISSNNEIKYEDLIREVNNFIINTDYNKYKNQKNNSITKERSRTHERSYERSRNRDRSRSPRGRSRDDRYRSRSPRDRSRDDRYRSRSPHGRSRDRYRSRSPRNRSRDRYRSRSPRYEPSTNYGPPPPPTSANQSISANMIPLMMMQMLQQFQKS